MLPDFPDIEYSDNYVPEEDLSALPSSSRGMYTKLINRGFVEAGYLEGMGVHNAIDLENAIVGKINSYEGTDSDLREIFCLIHIWGGSGGRSLFIRGKGFVWDEISDSYRSLVDECLRTPVPDSIVSPLEAAEQSVVPVYVAVNDFAHRNKYIGASFATKHARFWMMRNNPRNPLPIYDTTFAEHLMGRGAGAVAELCDVVPYWCRMIQKAKKEKVSLFSLERQLFHHYRNQ